jgi:hypothetical protein
MSIRLSLLRLLQNRQATTLPRRQQPDAPVTAPAADKALPDRPSLAGEVIRDVKFVDGMREDQVMQQRKSRRLINAVVHNI